MANTTDPLNGRVVINETVDGVAVQGATARRAAKGSPTVKQKADPYIWGIYIMLLMVSVIELFSASSTEVSVCISSAQAASMRVSCK